eukprot:jgi/Mesvir1/18950/Mv18919-RA.1
MLHGTLEGGEASVVDRVLARQPQFQKILSLPPSGSASSRGTLSSVLLDASQVDCLLRVLSHEDVETEPHARARNSLLLEAVRSDAFMQKTLPWTLRERGVTPSQVLQVVAFCSLVLRHLPQSWREVPLGDIRDAAERLASKAGDGGNNALLATLQSQVAELRQLRDESERITEGATEGLGLNVPLSRLPPQPRGGRAHAGAAADAVWVPPPMSHRELSVIPAASDLVQRDPHVRANVVGGVPWQCEEHYLDTTFRLMRENFLQPLREAIEAWAPPAARGDRRTNQGRGGSSDKRVRQDSVHVYHDVKMARVATGKGGELVLFLAFRTATPVDFGRSQALQHGNAVFLVQVGTRGGAAPPPEVTEALEGQDGTGTAAGGPEAFNRLDLHALMERNPPMLVATVSDRTPLEEGQGGPARGGKSAGGARKKGGARAFAGVSQGFIGVTPAHGTGADIVNWQLDGSYLMLESIVFWPSVEPVLRRLRTILAEDLPFPEALVSLQGGEHPPLYIRSNARLPVAMGPAPQAALPAPARRGGGAIPGARGAARPLNGAGVFRAYPQGTMDVINGWPTDYHSPQVQAWQPVPDEFQFEALRHIMTHQVSLVQGPPGTGKTFTTVIAVKLMVAAAARSNRPIVIICYTNHALDQILAKLATQFGHDRIVRMGGTLKDESLRPCTVQEASKEGRSFQTRKQHSIIRKQMDHGAADMRVIAHPLFVGMDALDACEELRQLGGMDEGAPQAPVKQRGESSQPGAAERASKSQRAAQQVAQCLAAHRGQPLGGLARHFRQLLGRYDLGSEEEGLRIFLEGKEEAVYGAKLAEEREAKRRELEARRRELLKIQNRFQALASGEGDEGGEGEDMEEGDRGDGASAAPGQGGQGASGQVDGEDSMVSQAAGESGVVDTDTEGGEGGEGGGDEPGGWETVTAGGRQHTGNRAQRAAERAAQAAEMQGCLEEQQAALGTLEEEMDYLDSSILFMRERRGGGDPNDDDEDGEPPGMDGGGETAGEAGAATWTSDVLPAEWAPYLQAAKAAESREAASGGAALVPAQPATGASHKKKGGKKGANVPAARDQGQAEEVGGSQGGAVVAVPPDMASTRRRCFPWNIPYPARLGLLVASLRASKEVMEGELAPLMAQQEQLKSELSAIRRTENLDTMRRAAVVGMTSTKAAGETELLMQLNPAAVVVEECGELLEGQLLACLPKDLEHLVLVGDHEQLRPKVECYELERRCNIHVSMFERLITPRVGSNPAAGAVAGAPGAAGGNDNVRAAAAAGPPPLAHVRLKVQMRMRPEVSRLVRLFYPDLIDHESVHRLRPHVQGVCRSVAMINHAEPEAGEQKSKTNTFEAGYAAALTAYLIAVRQFAARDITIIAAYLGQRFLIVRHLMELGVSTGQADPNNPRIVTIDDYQGEENEIIILSLVRSNNHEPTPSFGFMKVRNRIIVALSRARCGLFILGNGTMFARNEHWGRVIAELRDMDAYFPAGTGLELSCPRHPGQRKAARTAQDFKMVSHGGCAQNCGQQLACGHTCPLLCHPQERHDELKCQKPCALEHPGCGHRCQGRCSQKPCPPCQVAVPRTLACGHTVQMACSDKAVAARCKEFVTVTLPCGHTRANVKCCDRKNLTCKEPCSSKVNPGECGRRCALKCSHDGAHECKSLCERPLMCAHGCNKPCANCRPHECECLEPCEYTCRHTVCRERCSAPCVRCVEPCGWACPHKGGCTRLCHEVCDRDPCDERCPKKACKKGHACAGLCGEPCPPCVTCDLPEDWSDPVMLVSKDELDCDQKLYKLDCGHVFLVETLDGHMAAKGRAIAMKGCPICRRVIYEAPRYGQVIKRNRLGVEEVKLKIAKERAERARRLAELHEAGDRSAALQLPDVTWYRCSTCACPFAVGDCGELDEVGNCANCQARIGGGGDATRMDPQELRALRDQGMSEYERQLAINAMRNDRGLLGTAGRHWFSCPNNHPFFIGECGGAMERASCPECGEVIGGEQHALVTTNRFAGDMDNPTGEHLRPHWPQGQY